MLSNRLFVCLVTVGFLGLTGCGVQPEEKINPIRCLNDSDCKSSEFCRMDPSNEPACLAEGCLIRTQVAEGRCESKPVPPPKPPQPSVCSKDSDCKRGERCLYTGVPTGTRRIQGRCAPVQVEPPPTACYSDSDCGQNELCELSPVPPQEGGAPTQGTKTGSAPAQGTGTDAVEPQVFPCMPQPQGRCVPKPPVTCYQDSDCAQNERCELNPMTGTKTGSATAQGSDPDNTTQAFPCMPQPEGRCVPKPPVSKGCTSDADCAQNERCEQYATCAGLNCPPPPPAACVPKTPTPAPCAQDNDCAQGQICYSLPCDAEQCGPSYCIAKPVEPTPARCVADADCKSGQRCEHFATCTAIGCPPAPPSVCVDIKP